MSVAAPARPLRPWPRPVTQLPQREGSERWGLPHGPEGGPGNTVAVAPSAPETVYLGTGRGVFRSRNGGRSWTSAGLVPHASTDGSSVPGVTSLVVDTRTPSTVYAGLNSQWDGGKWNGGTTYRRALYKTTDGGKTWRALDLIGQPVAISPTGPPVVYAAAGGHGGTSRLLRSADGGRSWQPSGPRSSRDISLGARLRPDDAEHRLRRDGPAWDLREQRRRRGGGARCASQWRTGT